MCKCTIPLLKTALKNYEVRSIKKTIVFDIEQISNYNPYVMYYGSFSSDEIDIRFAGSSVPLNDGGAPVLLTHLKAPLEYVSFEGYLIELSAPIKGLVSNIPDKG